MRVVGSFLAPIPIRLYAVPMRGPEGKFQDGLLETLRGQGVVCQKWNDLYSEGIPDVLAVLPSIVCPPGWPGPWAAWMELKAIKNWPKRLTTKLPAKSKPTAGQKRWMGAFATRQYPCFAVLNTPDGWIAVDHYRIDWLWSLPWPEIQKRVTRDQLSFGRILRSVNANQN